MSRVLRSLAIRRAALAVLLALAITSCAPGLNVTRWKPARFNLGATRKVAVLGVAGNPAAAPLVYSELEREVLEGKFYSLINATQRGLSVIVTDSGGLIDVAPIRQQVDADVYVSAQVLRYDFNEVPHEETRTVNGRSTRVVTFRPEARASVSFQVIKSDGRVLVYRTYDGVSQGGSYDPGNRSYANPANLMLDSLRRAVKSFLGDITPHAVNEKLVLDDSDPLLKSGVELAVKGDLDGAEHTWSDAVAKDSSYAGAIYNLGVLSEVRGDPKAASERYARAFALNPKSIYKDALDELNQRLRETASLQKDL